MTRDARFLSLVAARVRTVLDDTQAEFGRFDPEIGRMLGDLVDRASGGGKGTRASFVHYGWMTAGGAECAPTAVSIATAFELLHLSALVHDDVIDSTVTRRGRTAVHEAWRERHLQENWAGDSRRLGDGAALLVGNVLWAAAHAALGKLNDEARAEWNRVEMEVNLGQYLDLVAAAQRRFEEEPIRVVMELKTARYTVERPLRTGALATGTATESLLDELSRFGNLVGVAFQVRDDILGVFGDSNVTGKPTGSDLREGKATLLVSRAFESGDKRTRHLFARVGSPDLTTEEIEEMKRVMTSDGILRWAEETSVGYVEEAVDLLANLTINQELRDELTALAWSAVTRDR